MGWFIAECVTSVCHHVKSIWAFTVGVKDLLGRYVGGCTRRNKFPVYIRAVVGDVLR